MRFIPRVLRTPYAALAALFALLALIELSTGALLSGIDHRSGDFLLRQIASSNPPDPEIVIVDIDERSLDLMAPQEGRYPWARSVHAQLVEGLERQKPKAIVFDILFTDPDLLRPDADAYLAEVAQQYDNLFFPYVRLDSASDAGGLALDEYGEMLGFKRTAAAQPGAQVSLSLPMMPLAQTGRLGAINYYPDSDGVGRHYDLHIEAHGWRLPTMPARVASALGYPLPNDNRLLLNWHGSVLSRLLLRHLQRSVTARIAPSRRRVHQQDRHRRRHCHRPARSARHAAVEHPPGGGDGGDRHR